MAQAAVKTAVRIAAGRWKGRKPVLVYKDGKVIADVDVIVSEKDPNSWRNPDYDVVRRVRCQR
jgi:hypothetical protein